MDDLLNSADDKQRAAGLPRSRGRPKGARNKKTVIVEQIMSGEGAAITRSVITAALNGDMTACKIILDRIAPIRRGRPVQF